MSSGRTARVFDPLAWWDVAALYERYAGAFDLLVYCAFFTAVAHLGLRRKFPGRSGRVLAGVTGIALGTALAATASHHAWSLRRAGPLAIAFGLLAVGMVLFQLFRVLDAPGLVALALTYLLMFLLMHAVSPELIDYLNYDASGLALALHLTFYGCLAFLFGALVLRGASRHGLQAAGYRRIAHTAEPWRDREGKLRRKIKKVSRKPVASSPAPQAGEPGTPGGLGRRLRRLLRSAAKWRRKEKKTVSKTRHHALPSAQHKTARIEHTLSALRVEARKPTPSWQSMARAVSRIAHEADTTVELIDRVRTLDRRIRTMDWREYEAFRQAWEKASDEEKETLRKHILLERNKIVQESAIDALAQRCEVRHRDFRRALDDIGRAAVGQQQELVLNGLTLAAEIEEAQKKDLRRIAAAEKKLQALIELNRVAQVKGGPSQTGEAPQDEGAPPRQP